MLSGRRSPEYVAAVGKKVVGTCGVSKTRHLPGVFLVKLVSLVTPQHRSTPAGWLKNHPKISPTSAIYLYASSSRLYHHVSPIVHGVPLFELSEFLIKTIPSRNRALCRKNKYVRRPASVCFTKLFRVGSLENRLLSGRTARKKKKRATAPTQYNILPKRGSRR